MCGLVQNLAISAITESALGCRQHIRGNAHVHGGRATMHSFVNSSARRFVGLIAALLLTAAAVVVLTSLRSTASADPYPPSVGCSLSVSSSSGGSLTLTGSGYGANQTLSITADGASLGSVTTDSTGAFQTTVQVPSSGGSQTIVVGSSSTSCSTSTTSGVAAERNSRSSNSASGSGSSSGSGTGGLASTGVKVLAISTLGALLIAGGLLVTFAGRRRRT
jgi:hypothetical protein